MARKYLRYLVTRNDQYVNQSMIEEILDLSKKQIPNILTYPSLNTWVIDEALKSGFYCNWPNTDNCRYVVTAEPIIVQNGCRIEPTKSVKEENSYFGYYILNGDNHIKFLFDVEDESAEILIEDRLLLISPANGETHKTTYWSHEEPLVMIKFYIKPVESVNQSHPWIPF